MNTNNKIILFSFFFIGTMLFFRNEIKSQKLFYVFVHGITEMPGSQGIMSAYDLGIGGEVGGGVKVLKKTFFTGTMGYSLFKEAGKTELGKLHVKPIRFGIRQNLFPLNLFYIHLDAGPAFIKNKEMRGSCFNGSVGAGVKLSMFEFQADYEWLKNDAVLQNYPNGWVTLKLGWRFGL